MCGFEMRQGSLSLSLGECNAPLKARSTNQRTYIAAIRHIGAIMSFDQRFGGRERRRSVVTAPCCRCNCHGGEITCTAGVAHDICLDRYKLTVRRSVVYTALKKRTSRKVFAAGRPKAHIYVVCRCVRYVRTSVAIATMALTPEQR